MNQKFVTFSSQENNSVYLLNKDAKTVQNCQQQLWRDGFRASSEPTIPHRTSRLKCVKHESWVGTSMVMKFGYFFVGCIAWSQIPPNQWLLSWK